MLGRFLHAVRHRRDVGVEAHAGVLNVENEHVDSLQHRDPSAGASRRRGCRFGKPVALSVAFATFASDSARNSVLGTENRDELHAIRVRQHINRAPPMRIDACLIRDQPDALAPQRRKVLLFQDVNACLVYARF